MFPDNPDALNVYEPLLVKAIVLDLISASNVMVDIGIEPLAGVKLVFTSSLGCVYINIIESPRLSVKLVLSYIPEDETCTVYCVALSFEPLLAEGEGEGAGVLDGVGVGV